MASTENTDTALTIEQLDVQIAWQRRIDEWHQAEGHVFCWCGNWVHPDDLYEGTCGGRDCLRSEAQDRAGLVP